jgi:hypothetical protein
VKKFILGFILGALLCSVMPIKAAIEEYICYKSDYALIINGTQYSNPELPLLNYQGYTYGPLRPMLEAAGFNVNWNAKVQSITAETKDIIVPESIFSPDGIECNYDIDTDNYYIYLANFRKNIKINMK